MVYSLQKKNSLSCIVLAKCDRLSYILCDHQYYL